jgi:cytosine/adenosine deaminase-related metal-dependent hydrolase
MAGHGVFLTDEEMDTLKETETTIIHNPESNMNNGVGIPQVEKMLNKGILVGLGTDGMTYDMFQEFKSSYLIHKHNSRDPRVMSVESFKMLFQNNGKLVSKFFPKPVGKLEKGAFADVIILDYHPPTPLNVGNFPWHFMFGMNSSMVNTTICGGKVFFTFGFFILISYSL